MSGWAGRDLAFELAGGQGWDLWVAAVWLKVMWGRMEAAQKGVTWALWL